ncbi:MAG: lipid-A-disaccharide synthase [Gemmatimonadetes bacterium]|nr:lipid-A-disaccharide synthase [Gemmatimonadota bacterium]
MRPPGSSPTIFLSAGEASGDLHGAGLARALKARWPDARLLGLGGDRMKAEGVELLAHVSELAIMGLVEVVRHLPFLLALRRRVFAVLAAERVDLVIPIDYPGFNLRLARRARERGVPVLYYVAPQVWAWHESRTRALSQDADMVAVILPFEEAFLRERGVSAQFVGHPLLDAPSTAESRTEWAARQGLRAEQPILAVFPGSRPQEIGRLLQIFSGAAAQVHAARPDVQPVIAAAPHLNPDLFTGTPWPRINDAQGLLHHADVALVKSGTTTLEATLAGIPFVVAYRVNPLSYYIARRLVRVPFITLTNLIAEREIVPELVQDKATPDALAAALLPLLNRDSPDRQAMVRNLAEVRAQLGQPGAAERVVELAASLIQSRK